MTYQTVLRSLAVCGILGLSACAELNGALDTANSILGSVNGAVGAVSNAASGRKIYKLGNRSTAQYEVTGLEMLVYQIDSTGEIDLSGRIKNKTNKSITVDFTVPVYEKDGDYWFDFMSFIVVPPHETAKISDSKIRPNWKSGAYVNPSKFKISVRRF